jgi:polysaccharide biosynthesis transport protein
LKQLRQPSMLQEAVRRLNAQISLTDFGRASNRTLLVTSSEAREGKSFVALGLAQFGAASGKRVLLIECDLRRPSMAKALKADDTSLSGLTAFLSGKVGHVPVVHLPHHLGFDIVFAGEPNIASTEMLTGQRFTDVLQMAKAYDLVLIDSPPCGLLMDAGVIAPRVDGVLFCAQCGRATPDVVNANLKNLQDAGASIVGLVMTFTPPPSQWLYGYDRIYGPSRLISHDA